MTKERLINDVLQGLLMAAVVAMALPIPDLVWAQTDVGSASTLITNNELNPLTSLVSGLFYVGGGVLMGAGALKLKEHAENPTQNPIRHGISRIGVGAALLGIPYFSQLAVKTLNYGTNVSPFAQFSTISSNG